SGASFNRLVGRGLQGERNGKAERLGSLQINDELKLRGLHDRQIARLSSFKNSSDVVAGLSIAVGDARSIANQPASHNVIAPGVDRRNGMTSREGGKLITAAVEENV